MKKILRSDTDGEFLRKKTINAASEEALDIINEMLPVLKQSNGVGLAANQIGIDKSIILMLSPNGGIHAFINPVIVKASEKKTLSNESCLSCEGVHTVLRSKWIKVKSIDNNGRSSTLKFEGTEAIILQHEIDHLNGRLIIDA